MEDAELEWQAGALGIHGGVDAAGVELEPAELLGREDDQSAISCGADLEGALEAVVREQGCAGDFCEVAGDVAAEGAHLPEAVLRCNVALGDDEVVEVCCADVGNAVSVALYGDWSGEAGDGEVAVELGERVVEDLACEMAGGEEAADAEDNDECGENEEGANKDAAAQRLQGSIAVIGRGFAGAAVFHVVEEGRCLKWLDRGSDFVGVHALIEV